MYRVNWCLFLCLIAGTLTAKEVTNGKIPKGKPQTIQFTVDLRVGDEEDDHYFWTGLNPTVTVDKRGHMFVADNGSNRVLEYDANGQYVRTVMRAGEGPGEAQNLMNFTVLKDQRAIGFDLPGGIIARLNWFDKDLKFVEEVRPKKAGIVGSMEISPSGTYMAATITVTDMANNKMSINYGLYDADFQSVHPLSTMESPLFNPFKLNDSGYWQGFLSGSFTSTFQSSGVIGFDEDGNVYTAMTREYEITKWSSDLKNPAMIIKKEYNPIYRSEAELEYFVSAKAAQLKERMPEQFHHLVSKKVIGEAVAKAEIPPIKRAVFGLLPMPEGRLLVIHDHNIQTRRAAADIFSEEGKYLGQVAMDNFAFMGDNGLVRMIFRNGYAYSFETDEDRNHFLVRYTYKLAPAS